MISKYIKEDSIPWLTDGKNPAVRYNVKNEILKNQDKQEIYKELLESNLTEFFYKNCSNGVLGDYKNPDLFYKGSVWFFLLAVESGFNQTTDFIFTTADYISTKTQLNDGGFKFNYKSDVAVGCRTGNMIFSFLKCGLADERTLKGIKWIIKNQRKDGGWLHCPIAGFCDVMKIIFLNKSGNGLKYENIDDVKSCPVASFYCLKALVFLNDNSYKDIVKKGADFFINNNLFIHKEKKLLCGNSICFDKIGYPVMSQYDYLSGMILLYETGGDLNRNNEELFNAIIKKQNDDGTWNCENRLNGMIKEKGIKSRWITLNALRLINTVLKIKSV